MATVVETLGAASKNVIDSSFRMSNDGLKLARWIMTLRVNLRVLDSTIMEATKNNEYRRNAYGCVKMAVEQIETLLNDLDTEVVGELNAASASIDAVIEFAQDRAAYNTHHTNDPAVRREVLALTSGRCAYCDIELVDGGGDGNQFCVEHVIPASKGGPNHLVNYVPACRSCNNSKSDNHVLLFIRRNLPRKVSIVPVQTAEAAE